MQLVYQYTDPETDDVHHIELDGIRMPADKDAGIFHPYYEIDSARCATLGRDDLNRVIDAQDYEIQEAFNEEHF